MIFLLFLFPFFLFSQPTVQDERVEDILTFWFGNYDRTDWIIPEGRTKLWFGKDEVIDSSINKRYGPLLIELGNGKLEHWKKSTRGLLALIILTDQFPRNIYRESSQAFAYDSYSLSFAEKLLSTGKIDQLHPIEKVFVYLPFEHAESANLQHLSVMCYENLLKTSPERHQSSYQGFLSYAIKHRDIVVRFGRFPHRNRLLDRLSTPEEEKFLQQPGSSF